MPSRTDHAQEGRRIARRIRVAIGEEIRSARLLGGLSQQVAGAAAAMSHAQFGRIERGEIEGLTIDQLSRAGTAVGLRVVVRAYPDGDAVIDAGQQALLARFARILPADAHWRTEVPLPIQGDRRAWDGIVTVAGIEVGVEAETRLRDIQALERRLALKQRDGGIETVVLLVADTRSNRQALAAHRQALKARFPSTGGDVRRCLATGTAPEQSGIVLL